MKIGVFDSGYGGLTVLGGLLDLLPQYDYVYLGDNARAPYGNRPADEVLRFATEAVGFLAAQRCSLIVVACNTASSEALRIIQQQVVPEQFPQTKVLGVLIPSAEAVKDKGRAVVGVIGTAGTVASGAYEREIAKVSPGTKVVASACPALAGLVERGEADGPAVQDELIRCLKPVIEAQAEALILGCTHYPLILDTIKQALPPGIEIINPPALIAKSLAAYLERHPEIERKLGRFGLVQYFTTASAKDFWQVGRGFLGRELGVVKQIRLS